MVTTTNRHQKEKYMALTSRLIADRHCRSHRVLASPFAANYQAVTSLTRQFNAPDKGKLEIKPSKLVNLLIFEPFKR